MRDATQNRACQLMTYGMPCNALHSLEHGVDGRITQRFKILGGPQHDSGWSCPQPCSQVQVQDQ